MPNGRENHAAHPYENRQKQKANERYSNGNARRKLRARLKAERRGCWICRAFGRPPHIDYSLPARDPMAFEVDELCPVSKWREGGYPSAMACALDYGNVDAAHRRCNEWRGNRSVAQVLAIARGEARASAKSALGSCTREW